MFKETDITLAELNPFEKIGKNWFLLTAGREGDFNTMTASWGFMGVIWGKNCVETVVRPCRYTYEFLKKNDYFTFSFLPEKYRKELAYCGKNSGRDVDKIAETKLTPVFADNSVYFDEADTVLVCRKIYVQEMSTDALDPDINRQFNDSDPIHCQFIGEITKALLKE